MPAWPCRRQQLGKGINTWSECLQTLGAAPRDCGPGGRGSEAAPGSPGLPAAGASTAWDSGRFGRLGTMPPWQLHGVPRLGGPQARLHTLLLLL